MKKTTTTLGILMLGLAISLGSGCSRDEVEDAAAKAKDTAAEAAASANAAAADAVAMADKKVDEAAAMVDTAIDPVARCQELAAKGAWADALEPCAKAHEMKPDDMGLEHALQQAKAAAAQ
jgi:hypothetical protein